MDDTQLLDGLEQLAAGVIITIKFEPSRGTLPAGFELAIGRVNIWGEDLREALERAVVVAL